MLFAAKPFQEESGLLRFIFHLNPDGLMKGHGGGDNG